MLEIRFVINEDSPADIEIVRADDGVTILSIRPQTAQEAWDIRSITNVIIQELGVDVIKSVVDKRRIGDV